MLFHALTAFLLLPGIIAGVIPFIIVQLDFLRYDGFSAGYIIISLGFFLLLWCVRDFYIAGKGTLAPWCPPQKIVIHGLYKYCRNPMYLSVVAIISGWAIISGSLLLLFYAAIVFAAFHLRVVFHEEPRLAHHFSNEWLIYSESVRRWLPRITPWNQDEKNSR